MVHMNHEIKRRLEKLNPVCRSYLFKRARKFLWPLPWQTDSLWNPVDKRKCKQYRKKEAMKVVVLLVISIGSSVVAAPSSQAQRKLGYAAVHKNWAI